ncbi:MMPL family transporter [bacterium]|nr:MMPL family transporter [bacterium]
MLKKIISSLAVFSFQKPKTILFSGLFLAIVLGFFASKLTLNSNFIYLVPQDSQIVKSFWEASSDFGATEYLVVLLELREGKEKDLAKLQKFADFYVSKLKNIPEIISAEQKIDSQKQKFLADFFVEHALLYLEEKDLQAVLDKLSDEKIAEQIKTDKDILSSPIGSAVKKTIIGDPLMISEILKKYFEKITGKKEESFGAKKEWYFLSNDEQALLVLIRPTKLAQDPGFSKILMGKVDQATKEAFGEFEGAKDLATIGFAGGYVSSISNEKSIQRDLVSSSGIVLIGIVLIFYLFYRNKRSLAYIVLPLLLGIIWTLGLAYLVIGSLNVITVVSSAILMGLGIDYSIHLYNRYLETDLQDTLPIDKIRATFSSTGVGVFYGALTSAFVFIGLMITDFKGLSELGFVSGSGLLLILFAMFTVFPAELSFFGTKEVQKKLHFQETLAKLMEQNFRFVITHPKYIVTGTALVTIFMLVVLTGFLPTKISGLGVPFEEDLQKIRPETDKDIQVQAKISEKFNSNFKPLYVISKDQNSDKAIEKVSLLSATLDSLKVKGIVDNYQTITDYVPSLERQVKNIELIKKVDIEKVIKKINYELKENGFKPEKFETERLRKAFSIRKPIKIEDFERLGFHDVISKFYVNKDNEYRIKTQVFLNGYVEDLSKITSFEKDLKESGNQDTVTGIRVVVAEFMKIVKHDFFLATIFAALSVVITVIFTYRKTKHVILSLLPLTIAMIWMFGSMKILGIKINYANMIVTPLILGIGIDYGIYILTRYLENKEHDIFVVVRETGISLIFSALTTILGFGSLIFSQNRGIESIGILSTLGVVFCTVNSLILLPALLELLGRKQINEN